MIEQQQQQGEAEGGARGVEGRRQQQEYCNTSPGPRPQLKGRISDDHDGSDMILLTVKTTMATPLSSPVCGASHPGFPSLQVFVLIRVFPSWCFWLIRVFPSLCFWFIRVFSSLRGVASRTARGAGTSCRCRRVASWGTRPGSGATSRM
jgi:hypothetical protein